MENIIFYWSVDSIVIRKPEKAIPIAISAVLLFLMIYTAIGMAAI